MQPRMGKDGLSGSSRMKALEDSDGGLWGLLRGAVERKKKALGRMGVDGPELCQISFRPA